MSWYDWLAPIVKAGTSAYDAISSTNANNQATQTSNQAQQQALIAKQEGQKAAQAQYVLEQERLQNMQATAAPAIQKVQQLINRNPGLTPAQQLALDEARRQGVNTMVAGGMAGNGRALTAGIRSVEDTMRSNFIDSNQKESNQAATGLAGQYYTAGQSAANVNNLMAKNAVDGGANSAAAITDVGASNYLNTLANQKINTNAVGGALTDISGVISNQMKQNAMQNNGDGQYTGINKKQVQQPSGQTFGGT